MLHVRGWVLEFLQDLETQGSRLRYEGEALWVARGVMVSTGLRLTCPLGMVRDAFACPLEGVVW